MLFQDSADVGICSFCRPSEGSQSEVLFETSVRLCTPLSRARDLVIKSRGLASGDSPLRGESKPREDSARIGAEGRDAILQPHSITLVRRANRSLEFANVPTWFTDSGVEILGAAR